VVKHCTAHFIEEKLKGYNRKKLAAAGRVAAVLLPLVRYEDECCIIFTKRLRGLNQHGGEISFPGGLKDDADSTALDTVLRETYEEIGVESEYVRILGTLDDELSKWGHRVTPYVGLLSKCEFRLQAAEVDRLYRVPVSHIVNKKMYYSENWIKDGISREVHFYRYLDDVIWGLTARILFKFITYIAN